MSQLGASNEVRIGVIGLGRQWTERYRAALIRPGGRARVVAVCDAVAHRAEAEADRIGCDTVEGLTHLIERPDVEIVFLLDPLWFGLWPLRVAIERRKPVFTSAGHRATLDELSRLNQVPSDPPPLVMTELTSRFAPEMLRLRELLATELGPARRVLVKGLAAAGSSPATLEPDRSSPADAAIGLIDRCRALVQANPLNARLVRKSDRPGRQVRVVSIDFSQGATARLSLVCGSTTPEPEEAGEGVKMLVETERGRARIDRSGRLAWSLGADLIREPISGGSATSLMIDHVLRRVRGEQSLAPDLDELRDLERSSRVFEW
ncbi:Gfo/Idh/MocA family oxidoreductase [Tautonia marina]|uniref:Gfo/Idh/MocA family oxidoreductase n=1 Tax=Tautonia marina TaxID=2653855 RepID=UPI001376477F|nr:Gfo/Idh/MocA family oxidoreductase [Tautonia marina]